MYARQIDFKKLTSKEMDMLTFCLWYSLHIHVDGPFGDGAEIAEKKEFRYANKLHEKITGVRLI